MKPPTPSATTTKSRDAVGHAGRATVGTDEWWKAVEEAREQNSDHIGEEERGALADFRAHTPSESRRELGAQFAAFKELQAAGRDLTVRDRDPPWLRQRGVPVGPALGAGERCPCGLCRRVP